MDLVKHWPGHGWWDAKTYGSSCSLEKWAVTAVHFFGYIAAPGCCVSELTEWSVFLCPVNFVVYWDASYTPETLHSTETFTRKRQTLAQCFNNVINYWVNVSCILVWKKQKMFLPHPRVKVSIVGSLRDREVACSASDRQGSNFKSCVWRTVSSQSSHHPQEVLLAQFSLYVHKGGLRPDSFHFGHPPYTGSPMHCVRTIEIFNSKVLC